MDPSKEAYKKEAYALLADLETFLSELGETTDDEERIDCIFRVMHTFKLTGAMFGFGHIAKLAREVEMVFDQVRKGEIAVDGKLVEFTISARDQIRAMFDASDHGESADASMSDKIIASPGALLPN